jgi:hypothetical protein
VTVAFGTTALFGSVTVPLIVPAVRDWAKAEQLRTNEMAIRKKNDWSISGRVDLRIMTMYLTKFSSEC